MTNDFRNPAPQLVLRDNIMVDFVAEWELISAQAPHLNGDQFKGLFTHKTSTDPIFLFKPTTIFHSVTYLMLVIKKKKNGHKASKSTSLYLIIYSTFILKQCTYIVCLLHF